MRFSPRADEEVSASAPFFFRKLRLSLAERGGVPSACFPQRLKPRLWGLGGTALAVPFQSGSFCPYILKSSRRRRVWARLTGISVCFLSSIRNW